jgi:hypothetical protein
VGFQALKIDVWLRMLADPKEVSVATEAMLRFLLCFAKMDSTQ